MSHFKLEIVLNSRNQKLSLIVGMLGIVFLFGYNKLSAHQLYIDLTHPTPTFEPLDGDMNKPDFSKPHGDSDPRGIPSFGPQTVYQIGDKFYTNEGYFYAGRFATSEHHGTHIDASVHYINNEETLEGEFPTRKYVHEMTVSDLVGPVILVDISGRVASELDKNDGLPSPDTNITDFSNSSANVVTASDIEMVEGEIRDGSWIVINTGWSKFYYESDWAKSPYMNGFNYPGLNKEAVDKIIEIEDKKKIRINGIVADNIGIDSGESSSPGKDYKFHNAFYSHVRGMQRGWKFVENANYLSQLLQAKPNSCLIIVGAPNHIMGSGGPARIMAICDPK